MKNTEPAKEPTRADVVRQQVLARRAAREAAESKKPEPKKAAAK